MISYWLETNATQPEREGQYLICPVNSEFKKNPFIYQIMLELNRGDIVFHYMIDKRSRVRFIKSYSTVKNSFYISNDPKELKSHQPPFRKIDLQNNTQLVNKITIPDLRPMRKEIDKICEDSGMMRTPFDKNFRVKQLYLMRVPEKLAEIFYRLGK